MVILQPFPVLRGTYLGARCPHHRSSEFNFVPHHCGKLCIIEWVSLG